MTMATMRFADEVVSTDEICRGARRGGRGSTKKELDMAKALIDSLTSDFDAEQYRDEYREELLSLIERKAEGREHRQHRVRGAEADQGA